MAVPAQTTTVPTRIGVREDLDDWISNIDPTETPFQSSVGSAKQGQHLTEWQTDELVAPNGDNKTLEGDDLANEDRPATVRLGAHSQIFKKVVGTSTTAQATVMAGRGNEHKYQIAKAAKEMKRDKEVRYCGNYADVAGSGAVEGETPGAITWLTSNVDRGVGGANGTLAGGQMTGAATDGAQRAFTEAMLKAVLHDAWAAGGSPDMLLMGGRLKQSAATFTGLAQHRRETGDKRAKIVAGADMYMSDFGDVRFVASRFMGGRSGDTAATRDGNREAFLYDSEFWSESTLEPTQRRKLAVTGLSDRMGIYCNKTLRCHNDKANALIADLQP